MNREEWLTTLTNKICNEYGISISDSYKISCGWTTAGARKKQNKPVIEMIHKNASAGNVSR